MARCLILLVAVVVAVGACADDPSLDHESLLEGLPSAVLPDAPEVVADVSCPEPVTPTVARSSVCTASVHGESITIDVEIDEDGIVTAAVRESFLDLAAVESALVERLEVDLAVGGTPRVRVDCPGTVVVDRRGVQFDCTGESGGVVRPLVVTIVDDDGGWTVAFAANGG